MDFTFHGIPAKFFNANDTHTRTQQQSNKYSASIFPNHACMTQIKKYSFYS